MSKRWQILVFFIIYDLNKEDLIQPNVVVLAISQISTLLVQLISVSYLFVVESTTACTLLDVIYIYIYTHPSC